MRLKNRFIALARRQISLAFYRTALYARGIADRKAVRLSVRQERDCDENESN